MSKLNTAYKLIKSNPLDLLRAIYDNMRYSCIFRLLSDENSIKLSYRIHFGKSIDLDFPVTFNEKLQWLKLHNRKESYTNLVDKCAVKEYIRKVLGDEYVIKTLGIWKTFEEIDFSTLPNKFVLKCNHDSGSVVICKDKSHFDFKKAKKVLNRGLRRNLYYWGREYPYKNVQPCIFAEEYIEDKGDGDLKDYKFFCFNGKVKCYKVDYERFTNHRANYFDINGALLPISEKICPCDPSRHFEKPRNFEKMIMLAEKLSDGIPFLRVDYYNVDGKILFGELTFFPASGLSPFEDPRSDIMMGEWLQLDAIK